MGPARSSHSLSAVFVCEIADREPVARCRAISSARSSSSSAGTQSETSPMRSASAPSTSSHSRRRYFAFAIPHRSGQTIAAWSPAATPSFVWPSTIRAFGLASETSASRPTTRPAPTAGPGDRRDDRRRAAEHVVDEVASLVEDALPRLGVVGDREHEVEVAAGAEDAVGAADGTARVSSSWPIACQTRASSPCCSSLTALRRPGARSVNRRIPSSGRSRSSDGNSVSYWYGATTGSYGAALRSPRNGPVAQLVEQRTFNPKVAGSIPARPI